MERVPLSEIEDQLSHFLKVAERDAVLITRHGKSAGVLIGFKDEDDVSTTNSKTILGFSRALKRRDPVSSKESASPSKNSETNPD